jgi:formate dehydrogenase iron-sulfur subunit
VSVTLYVPRDAVALGLGANKVARALFAGAERRGLDVAIVRTGSRGLAWLEPMVEVGTPEGRIAYGPVTLQDVDALLDGGLTSGGAHPLRLGKPEEIPFLAKQQRLTFHRRGLPGARRLPRP